MRQTLIAYRILQYIKKDKGALQDNKKEKNAQDNTKIWYTLIVPKKIVTMPELLN